MTQTNIKPLCLCKEFLSILRTSHMRVCVRVGSFYLLSICRNENKRSKRVKKKTFYEDFCWISRGFFPSSPRCELFFLKRVAERGSRICNLQLSCIIRRDKGKWKPYYRYTIATNDVSFKCVEEFPFYPQLRRLRDCWRWISFLFLELYYFFEDFFPLFQCFILLLRIYSMIFMRFVRNFSWFKFFSL